MPADINSLNIQIGHTGSTDLKWLWDNYLKPDLRSGNPNLGAFNNTTFYKKNTAGNCNNENNGATLNCDSTSQCGTPYNCTVGGKNCTAINCVNCDAQAYFQTGNCNQQPAPTYNCLADQNCFSYNCNCSKIICTKLYEYGLMPRKIFEADQEFGTKLLETNPDIYNGYRAWAEIVVEWMEGKGPKMMPWMSDEQFSISAKKWSTSWALDIATPWAEEMAYIMGAKEKGSLTGKLMFAFGIPICKTIGVWQRWFGPSKKKTGFIKGAGLIFIFVMFKIISEIGRLIESYTDKRKLKNA